MRFVVQRINHAWWWMAVLQCLMVGGIAQAQVETNIVLNEVMANGNSYSDYVEIYNKSTSPINIGGWFISSIVPPNNNATNTYFLPSGFVLGGKSFIVVWLDGNTNIPYHGSFGLKGTKGDLIYLYQGPTNSALLRDSLTFGIQIPDVPLGRYPDGGNNWTVGPATPGTLNRVSALAPVSNLRINEWMAKTTNNGGDDWLELYNLSNAPVALDGLVLTVTAGLTNRAIPARSFIDGNGYIQFNCTGYKTTLDANECDFKLVLSGATIRLFDTNRATLIDSVTFGPQTNEVSQGRLPDGGTNILFFVTATKTNATPGASNFEDFTNLVVSELLAHTDPPIQDAVKFYNVTTVATNISGWWLSNRKDTPKKFRIPANTVVAAGGYVVFYEWQFDPDHTGNTPSFRFNAAHGDDVYLFSADSKSNLTGLILHENFGSSENGVSFGRHIKSSGAKDFMPMSKLCLGSTITVADPATPYYSNLFVQGLGVANAYPKIGPLVISEIMYHPPNILSGTNYVDNDLDEYLVLRNITMTNVPLYEVDSFQTNNNGTTFTVTNSWLISNAVTYAFPCGAVVMATSSVIVVNFDPVTNTTQLAAFRTKYNLSTNIPIYGQYKGKLANSMATIELYKPDPTQTYPHPDAGYSPFVMVEKIKYLDSLPWPTNRADGGGYSLHRLSLTGYSNDSTNWFTAEPRVGPPDCLPRIVVPPVTTHAALSSNVTLTATADGTGPITYQWLFNGTLLTGRTNSSMTITNAQLTHNGNYSVVMSNILGVTTNSVATLLAAGVPKLYPPNPPTNGVLSATVGMVSGRSYVILESYNLMLWFTNSIITNAPVQTNISMRMTNQSRFFCIQLLP